jgi:hypothetical protein
MTMTEMSCHTCTELGPEFALNLLAGADNAPKQSLISTTARDADRP